ncbi:anti-sigma factor [Rhodococcus sp. NPDC056743]|uniref:anti-sigma factor n=1 Tax=Rhodococcus sp. NPDC056743 TaxID=3345934 RepID=UPI0036718708
MTTLPTDLHAGSTIPTLACIRVPAAADQLSTLRGMTCNIAYNHGFDVDGVADLELAIDETASMLIALAAPGTDITCTFTAPENALRIAVSATSTAGQPAGRSSFSWFVLESLTDSVELDVDQASIAYIGIDDARRRDASNAGAVTITLQKNLLQSPQ